MWFFYIIVGILIGALICFFITRFLPAIEMKEIDEKNLQELHEKENNAQQQLDSILKNIQFYKNQQDEYKQQLFKEKEEIAYIQNQKEILKRTIDENIEEHRQYAEKEFEASVEQLGKFFQERQQDYEKEYNAMMVSYVKEFNDKLALQLEQQKQNEEILNSLKNTVDMATEAAKREEEMRNAKNFYCLDLSEQDVLEINKLRQVEPYLRDKEALNKVIWKSYYEKPYTDLIGRVIGDKIKTGIYKITNIKNQMCYVGQSVDIASRWKQHIKRGIGADTPTRNKLYPAMLSFGVENFTFEVIEECDKLKLDEREKYWQNFFNASTYGYSMR